VTDGPVRRDQSAYPNYRTPSRETERLDWEANRLVILHGWERGRSSQQIAWDLGPSMHGNARPVNPAKPGRRSTAKPPKYRSATTVRGMFQRIYNEAGVHGPAAALAAAYRLGWLPCPCGRGWAHGSHSSPKAGG
jgi:hypothetical protein